jgi:hypothetical protein
MPMTPNGGLVERHFDYVLGPNQDPRLASIDPGATIRNVELQMDADAPFLLRRRAVREDYAFGEEFPQLIAQPDLPFLKTKWTGPTRDYRQQDYVPEGLQMANFGQMGNPKSINPNVAYPANSILVVDLQNTGSNPITNLMFFWRGVKLFQPGAVQMYTYPPRMKGLWFNYQIPVASMGPMEIRTDQIFTVQPDADFVVRGGLATAPVGFRRTLTTAILLQDADKKPYSNDYIPLDLLFGCGQFPATIPIGAGPNFIPPFGPGPALPGLFYPEIYVPANHQLIYNMQRNDPFGSPADFTINLIGQKVYPQ